MQRLEPEAEAEESAEKEVAAKMVATEESPTKDIDRAHFRTQPSVAKASQASLASLAR